MDHSHSLISLGFTEEKIPVGGHICQIYSDDEEGVDSLLKFLLSGLQTSERTACFSEKVNKAVLKDYFACYDISYDEREQNKAMILASARDTYIQNNVFDPDVALAILANYYQESLDLGFSASRVIGEMSPEIQDVPGGNRLLEYESRVSMLLEDHPVTTVCQYNANLFDGATIMDVLKVHPQMIVRGTVVHNPFFIPPEEFLKEI